MRDQTPFIQAMIAILRGRARRDKSLRLQPEYRCWPVWDQESGQPVDPRALGLTRELAGRLAAWDALYQATYDAGDPARSGFPDLASERAWLKEGNALAARLAGEWHGEVSNAISGLTGMLEAAGHGFPRVEPVPISAAPRIGRGCRLPEIEEILARLERLAGEKEALPDWDGDGQDEVSRAQFFFASVLAGVPARYEEAVRRGLESPREDTRRWVEMALRWREAPD